MKIKKTISNFSYLSIIQIGTLLNPFIYYPYIIRKFSIDSYGLVIFIQSIIMLMSIIVDFGFNIYGTRIASENAHSKKKLSKIIEQGFILTREINVDGIIIEESYSFKGVSVDLFFLFYKK